MSFEGWTERALDEVIVFSNGKKRPQDSGNIPVYGGNGVMDYCNKSNTSGESIIIGRVGAYCGNVYYETEPCWISDNAILAKPLIDNDGKFLYYKLKNLNLAALRIGSSQPLLTQSILKEILTLIPGKITQKKIARILTSLDDKIELNNRMNKVLEQMAQAIFKQWFVDFEFPNENGEPYKSSGGEMVWCEELEKEIPKGWRVGALSDTAEIVMGQSPSSEYYNSSENGLPFHQGVANYGYRFPVHNVYCSQLLRVAKKGSILLSVRAPVGRLNIADRDIVIGRGLCALLPKIESCHSYLYSLLQSVFAIEDNFGSGTIFNAVSKKELESIKVLIPTTELAKSFNRIVSVYDQKIFNNCKQISALMKVRDTLLPKLMSGEIDVSEIQI